MTSAMPGAARVAIAEAIIAAVTVSAELDRLRSALQREPPAGSAVHTFRFLRGTLEAGARGYVLKEALNLDLAGAIKSVAAGQTVLDPKVARPHALKGERESGLTQRELEILQHIVAGKSNKEIASELELSANTVAVHRANIMERLGIHKTAELVVYAIRHGLVNLP